MSSTAANEQQPSAGDPAAASAPAEERPAPGGLAYWPLCLGIVLGNIGVDQLTKVWAKSALEPDNPFFPPIIQIIPGCFQLIYKENTGAAFSMFTDNTGILAVISVTAALALTFWWTRLPAREWPGRVALALVIAGAIGNLIDRAIRGYVIDFFHAYYDKWSWPVFNWADTLICVGVGLLMLRTWKGKV